MRGEDEGRPGAPGGGDRHQRGHHGVGDGGDEEGMGVPRCDVADRGGARAQGGACGVDRLDVALAARLDRVGREDHADGPLHARLRHAGQRVGEVRRPVPHADEDRERRPVGGERGLQPRRLPEGDLVQRRATADHLVVVNDLFDPLRGNPVLSATDDVGEEGPDLLGARGTAEGDQQHRVGGRRHGDWAAESSCTASTSART